MATASAPRRSRPVVGWAAVAGVSLLALTGLNLVADHFPGSGLDTFRNYLIRRNG